MTSSLDDVSTRRTIGRWTWAAAWFGLVVGQLHALARHATDEGRADLQAPLTALWAKPAAEALRPLLDWGDPDLVYVTYGKLWLPVFVALTLCAIVVRRRRAPTGAERWAWRVAISGYSLATAGVLLSYWTQWTGEYNSLLTIGFGFAVAGLLLTMLGSTALGVALLVRRARPLLPALLLALSLPLAVAILQVTSMGNAVLPILFAFGLLGRDVARNPRSDSQKATVGGAP